MTNSAEKLVPFGDGETREMLTFKQISERTGICVQTLRVRHSRGQALEAPRWMVRDREDRMRTNITNDKLRYSQDPIAQAVNSYLRGGEPMTTAQEIAELLECDLEEAIEIRDELRAYLFRGRATLEVLGDIFGLSRERIRQIQDKTTSALKLSLPRNHALRDMLDHMSELGRLRKEHPLDAVPVWGSSVGELTAFPKPNGGRRR